MDPFTSVIAYPTAPAKRDVKKVPFVELFGGRVQGVVSSGSDIKRVYVSYIEGGTGNYYCCTNNNRPCGGMRGGGCKHLQLLLKQACLQFGDETIAKYLGLEDAASAAHTYAIIRDLSGHLQKEPPAAVFSRFLNYLRYCELQSPPGTVHEMAWFVS